MRALVQRVSQAAVDVEREILCVSRVARPEAAEPLYDRFCARLGAAKGVFGACMGVA